MTATVPRLRLGSRPPERNVPANETLVMKLRHLRRRIALQQVFAELFEKRWMEPAIPLALIYNAFLNRFIAGFTGGAFR